MGKRPAYQWDSWCKDSSVLFQLKWLVGCRSLPHGVCFLFTSPPTVPVCPLITHTSQAASTEMAASDLFRKMTDVTLKAQRSPNSEIHVQNSHKAESRNLKSVISLTRSITSFLSFCLVAKDPSVLFPIYSTPMSPTDSGLGVQTSNPCA